MAHFAEIQDGRVVQVIVVNNDDAPTEAAGKAFIASLGMHGKWVQTSYNNNQIEGDHRGKFASIGDYWDGNMFIAPSTEPLS